MGFSSVQIHMLRGKERLGEMLPSDLSHIPTQRGYSPSTKSLPLKLIAFDGLLGYGSMGLLQSADHQECDRNSTR